MELHQLRYFLAVAREGSFVRAAEEEGIAQPSLSQQIKKLETELGVPLFDRLGRSVRLTRFGDALRSHAEAVAVEIGKARRSLDALKDPAAGSLIVGAIPTILPYALTEPLASFRKEVPRAQIDVREQTTEELIESLRTGSIDIAILALPVRQHEIVCSELFRERLLLALPPDRHIAEPDGTVPVDRLAEERMLLLREGHCLRQDVLTACTRAHLRFHQVFESDHLTSILAMVSTGFGVSLIPEMAARHAGACCLYPIRPASYRRIGYAQAAGHHSTPLQKKFIQWLRKWPWAKPAAAAAAATP